MGWPLKVPTRIEQFARYGLTGGAAAVVDLGGFTLLYPAVLPVFAAAACSFCIAAVVNYVLTSLFVFKEPLSVRRLVSFVAFALLGLGVNVGVTVASVTMIGCPAWMAKAMGIGVAFFVNFWLNALVVFRGPAAKTDLE